MVGAVKIPVTAKMRLRLGRRQFDRARPGAAALEDAGVGGDLRSWQDARNKGLGGTVNLLGIRAVVQAVKTIPVIGKRRHHHATGCEEDVRRDRLRGL